MILSSFSIRMCTHVIWTEKSIWILYLLSVLQNFPENGCNFHFVERVQTNCLNTICTMRGFSLNDPATQLIQSSLSTSEMPQEANRPILKGL